PHRKRAQQHSVDEGKDGRIGTDTECKREHRESRNERRAKEGADSEPYVRHGPSYYRVVKILNVALTQMTGCRRCECRLSRPIEIAHVVRLLTPQCLGTETSSQHSGAVVVLVR